MSLIKLLKYCFLLFLMQLFFLQVYSQDSCNFSAKEIKKLIAYNIPAEIDSTNDINSAYYIIDIKIDNEMDTIKSLDVFHKSISKKSLKDVHQLMDKLKTYSWKNNCKIDRILIPLFILPLSDNSKISDYPIELSPGYKITINNIHQYVFETVVITTNERMQ